MRRRWVVSGYDSLVEKFDGFAENYIGRYELLVVAANPRGESGFGNARPQPLAKEMLDDLRSDPGNRCARCGFHHTFDR